MYNLILTIGISVEDIGISFENYVQLDIKELLTNASKSGIVRDKFDAIRDFLIRNNSDLALGYVINNEVEYRKLKLLLVEKYRITQVYFQRLYKYPEYAKLYEKHSRWLDNSPEFVKIQDEKYNRELDELIKVLKLDNVEVIQVETRGS